MSTMKMAEPLLVSMAEAARLMGVSIPTAYSISRRADFPVVKLGGRTLVHRAMLDRWLERRMTNGQTGGDGNG